MKSELGQNSWKEGCFVLIALSALPSMSLRLSSRLTSFSFFFSASQVRFKANLKCASRIKGGLIEKPDFLRGIPRYLNRSPTGIITLLSSDIKWVIILATGSNTCVFFFSSQFHRDGKRERMDDIANMFAVRWVFLIAFLEINFFFRNLPEVCSKKKRTIFRLREISGITFTQRNREIFCVCCYIIMWKHTRVQKVKIEFKTKL